ncbi:MAG: hypothetical protein HRT57_12200 [Crocinitomicaceae bacterium]|nr:hypothetical protein [Crocinitomicaceae bacterium]
MRKVDPMTSLMKYITAVLIGMLTTTVLVAQESINQSLLTQVDDTTVVQDSVVRWASLLDMCEEFSTNKCANQHNFIETYDQVFSPLRDSLMRFFEIEILNGVSHLMWNDYFNDAKIFGIDIRDYSEKSMGTDIMTFVADQSNRGDLDRFIDTSGGHFNIILDDGGRAMDHQQVSLGHLFKHVEEAERKMNKKI